METEWAGYISLRLTGKDAQRLAAILKFLEETSTSGLAVRRGDAIRFALQSTHEELLNLNKKKVDA